MDMRTVFTLFCLAISSGCGLGALPDTGGTGDIGDESSEAEETGLETPPETPSPTVEVTAEDTGSADSEVDESGEEDPASDESDSTDECTWKEARTCQVLIDGQLEGRLEGCQGSGDTPNTGECVRSCELTQMLEHWDEVGDCYTCTTQWEPDREENAECDYEQWIAELECLNDGNECESDEYCMAAAELAAHQCRSDIEIG